MNEYLQNLIKVLGIGAAFAAIPLFASLAELQPPGPKAIGYLSAALVLLSSLIVWEWGRAATQKFRRRMVLAGALLTVVGLFIYLTLYSLYVDPVPGVSERVVRGFVCTEEAKLVYGLHCPYLPSSALSEVGWDAHELWTRSSVTTIKVSLIASWIIFTAGLIAAVGAVVARRKIVGSVSRRRGDVG